MALSDAQLANEQANTQAYQNLQKQGSKLYKVLYL